MHKVKCKLHWKWTVSLIKSKQFKISNSSNYFDNSNKFQLSIGWWYRGPSINYATCFWKIFDLFQPLCNTIVHYSLSHGVIQSQSLLSLFEFYNFWTVSIGHIKLKNLNRWYNQSISIAELANVSVDHPSYLGWAKNAKSHKACWHKPLTTMWMWRGAI
jgi:hypothetical protein